ncbi:MAG TPA: hypothetical protein PK228_03910 [Saprospiraceae bacterium]|nr:hypothetical protein [Saprospiraceae bacterium]
MNDLPVLSKSRPEHISLDFDRLRSEGVRHLERMATELWTDFNAHDPGITLLEVLCYALTDLAYRTRMISIEDLAAGDGSIKPWFEAEEILPTSPVTANDYRKLLIDVNGVKNAWLEKARPSDIAYEDKNGTARWYLKSGSKWNFHHIQTPDGAGGLQYDETAFLNWAKPFFPKGADNTEIGNLVTNVQNLVTAVDFNAQKGILQTIKALPKLGFLAEKIQCELAYVPLEQVPLPIQPPPAEADIAPMLPLNGIYKVILDLDDAVNPRNIRPSEAIAQRALNALHAQRGLCQDFLEPVLIEHRPICLCIDIEVAEEADALVAAAEMLYRIQGFLTPTPRFHTFKEMLAKGYKSDKIFNGPLLRNGFLDDAELTEAKKPATVIFFSDLLNIVAEVPGVISVREIRAKLLEEDTYPPLPQFRFPKDGEEKPDSKFVIDPCCTAIHVTRGALRWTISGEKLEEELESLRLFREGPPPAEPGGPEYPSGTFRPDLDEYLSLQYDLPAIYQVGEFSLPENGLPGQVARMRQLQAYLLFFDQVLAGYLAQLGLVRELLAVDQNIRKSASVLPALFEVPGVRQLMGDFAEITFISSDCDAANALAEQKVKESDDNVAALSVELTKAIANKNTELEQSIRQRIAEEKQLKSRIQQVPAALKTLLNKSFSGLTAFRAKLKEALGDNYPVFGQLPEDAVWERYIGLESNNLIEEMALIAEPPARHNDRRNRLLDHLIARFGETFSEFVVALARADQEPENNPWQQDYTEYLRDKANFLRTLPALQSERGNGYNYKKFDRSNTQPDVWNTDNVAGLQKRVCRLLGIDSFKTRSLIAEPPYVLDLVPFPSKTSSPQYALALRRNPDPSEAQDAVRREPLMMSKKFPGKKAALDARTELYSLLDDDISNNFLVEEVTDDPSRFQVVFRAASKVKGLSEHLLRSVPASKKEALYLQQLIRHLIQPEGGHDREGFHLIEHILLRPNDERDYLLELPLGCDVDEAPRDPYSFWLSVVLPGWTRRFQHPDFRYFLEQTFRSETPAHLAVRFCWLTRDEMQIFQPLFKNWREEKARCRPNECNVTDAANALIAFLNEVPCTCYCGEKEIEQLPCDPPPSTSSSSPASYHH